MTKKLGNLIKKARTDAGYTQEGLAKKVRGGITASDIGKFERGEKEPSQETVKTIAKLCGVTQKSLLDAMPAAKKTTGSTRSTGSSSTASKSSMQVTATERRLVELYRQADGETKKQALAVLRGTDVDDNVIEELLSGMASILGRR